MAEMSPKRYPVIVPLDTVEREDVEWLWERRIPKGRLTGLVGDPDAGKSTLALAIAARVSTGEPLPGDAQQREPGRVLLLTAEDGLADTVRPRLEDGGANLNRVHVLSAVRDSKGQKHMPNLVDDLPALEHALFLGQYSLVIIDPINAYLGVTVDTHRDAALRSVLAPLAALAERYKVAVLFILHLTKGQRDRTIYRAQGSIAYVAAARVVHLVGLNPGNEGERAMVCIKNNLAPKPASLAFEIAEGGFRWLGETALTADDLLAPDQGKKRTLPRDNAKDFLRELLAHGPVEAVEVLSKADAAGIARKTLTRAKDDLGISAGRQGFGRGGHWAWELPGGDQVISVEPPGRASES
jgi:hypothetical protein